MQPMALFFIHDGGNGYLIQVVENGMNLAVIPLFNSGLHYKTSWILRYDINSECKRGIILYLYNILSQILLNPVGNFHM